MGGTKYRDPTVIERQLIERQLIKQHLIETTFDQNKIDRNDTWSKRHLIKATLDRIRKQKIYNFESLSILSIFRPQNTIISKK